MIDKSTRRGMPRTLSSLVNDPWGSITMVARRAERVHTSSYVHGREVEQAAFSQRKALESATHAAEPVSNLIDRWKRLLWGC